MSATGDLLDRKDKELAELQDQVTDLARTRDRLEIRIEELEDANRWIPVDERLPEQQHTLYLTIDTQHESPILRWWYHRWENRPNKQFRITHWKPITPPDES